MKSIPLHPKHALAPALMFCRICGKDTNGIALLGNKADRAMQELHEATNGQYGSKNGYQEYGHNRIPDAEPCDECKAYLNGGTIIIAKDTGEYLRLNKTQVDSLLYKVADAKGRVLNFDAMRGKTINIPKAFWYADGDNIKLRDPQEWTE